MKKITVISLLLLAVLFIGATPYIMYHYNTYPYTDNTFSLGNSSHKWVNGYINNLYSTRIYGGLKDTFIYNKQFATDGMSYNAYDTFWTRLHFDTTKTMINIMTQRSFTAQSLLRFSNWLSDSSGRILNIAGVLDEAGYNLWIVEP